MAVVNLGPGIDPPTPAQAIPEELQLLRMADVVSITKLSKTKVYGLVASGDLPSMRSGKSIRVPLLALKQWILDHTNVTKPNDGKGA